MKPIMRAYVVAGLLVVGTPTGARAADDWGSATLVGRDIAPGSKVRFFVRDRDDFISAAVDTTVQIVRGVRPGPTLCITAGIHGDELNGVEIARRSHASTDPQSLAGTLLGLPMINMHGLRSGTRYLADRRDLNRFFPGSETGSIAALLARRLVDRVLVHCDALVDLHTASFHRRNLAQIRGDLNDERVVRLAQAFGADAMIHGKGPKGSLRRAALDAGIPSIIYEAGGPLEFQEPEIARGLAGIKNVMSALGMTQTPQTQTTSRTFKRSRWLRSPAGGIFLTTIEPGARVEEGALLGTVTDPFTDERTEIRASVAGDVIGIALPQFVLPGYALFHIGMGATPAPTP